LTFGLVSVPIRVSLDFAIHIESGGPINPKLKVQPDN
jgi:hypothetical protein